MRHFKNGSNTRGWDDSGLELAVLPKDPSSIPITHMAAYNQLWLQLQGFLHPLLTSMSTRNACGVQTYIQAK